MQCRNKLVRGEEVCCTGTRNARVTGRNERSVNSSVAEGYQGKERCKTVVAVRTAMSMLVD